MEENNIPIIDNNKLLHCLAIVSIIESQNHRMLWVETYL